MLAAVGTTALATTALALAAAALAAAALALAAAVAAAALAAAVRAIRLREHVQPHRCAEPLAAAVVLRAVDIGERRLLCLLLQSHQFRGDKAVRRAIVGEQLRRHGPCVLSLAAVGTTALATTALALAAAALAAAVPAVTPNFAAAAVAAAVPSTRVHLPVRVYQHQLDAQ